ncbi:hypothetical protein H257_13474 [Aphanomyces astaci]|uniref:Guanylate-binding protein N-terminal domain-containing protein n=1 Tax=Aphanomyces astaci TaxID=112090 RepID=W4FWA2_APHAT|nr:hypothetical protein H257_13474 [Aphanomyces astaci]ETV71049.1 hypothetical protein H257_13474 [Aphanomyces astaci]|eukprot:XP_009839295.1 hypothetical protein H257_13474 [Aphanomyces astaci]
MTSTSNMQAVKWLGMDRDGKMTVSPSTSLKVLHALPERHNVNLISIFGAARQGKSFLMNLLANQQDLFRISNEKEPCTQGVDLSSHFMPLEAFSRINGCPPVSSPNMSIGFVDAEGQGDRDITYDSRLVSPVLLASKVVIFNWKDSLQADRMLNLLAVLAKAAQNVELAEGETRKVFGHLHIVFRDWNFINTSPTEVHDTLFKKEKGASKEVSNRNLARHELSEAFESISIWLFPLPVVSTAQLSERIRFEQLQPSFQSKLRELRKTMSQQLQDPMLFNQQPLTGRKLADMMPLFAESLNDNRVIMPESIYSSMRRAEGKKIQLHAEDAIRNFCKAQLELPSLVDTQAFTAQVHLGLVKLVQGTLETLRSFPSDVADECHKALHLFVERELELASKSNNEKILQHFHTLVDRSSTSISDNIKQLEAALPVAPAALSQQCDAIVHDAVVSLQKCPKTTLRSFDNDIRRLEQQGLALKERLQHLNERAIRERSSKLLAQLSSCKSELKSKGTTWLDKQIASGTPFTISMLEEELLRLHASFDFGEPNPAVDEVDIEQEMREFHAQLLDDLKRQYTFHIRRVVLQFIGTAKSLLEKELQVIVLPMPDQKLRERIHESKERVVLDIASQMQGWSFPQEEMVHFGNAVTEYTQQLQDAYSKQNQSASKDSAAREASARYKVAKDALMHSLNEAIIGAIPMSVDALERLYDEHLLRTCTQLSDGHQIKHEKIMQSLKADLATLMMQLKTINTKETEKAALMNAAETERQRTEALANQVKQSQALAAKREQEMHSKLLEKETKSKHLLDELSSQEAKTQALERELQLAKQKAIELAEEKKRAEAEGLKLASKERQDAQRLIEENSTKQNKLQSELRAIQARLEQQQIILQAKEREVQAAEIAKEKAKQLSLEKDRALKAVERERALREKLSEDILSHQAQTAKLETTMSSVIREKTRETEQLQATLTDQERKTQQLEQELQRMKDQAQALAQEKEHWRRQNEAMAKSKLDMEMQVKDEAARREAAEAAAVQAGQAAEVAAKAAMEAMDVTPEKKRKTPVASSSSKKAKRLDVKAPLPKLSLQEAKRLAKEEMDKRVGERIAKLKK